MLLAMALGACSPDTGDLDAADSPVARYDWAPSDGSMDALLQGELAMQDGCLYVIGSEGGRTLAVFPRSLTSWDEATQTLTYGDVEFNVGDQISAGGGWTAPADSAVIPDTCELDEWGDAMHIQDESLLP